MDSVADPSVNAGARGERELTREELLAELERVVSRAKSDSDQWNERAATVTDDLLPTRPH